MSKNSTKSLTDTPAYKFANAIYRWFMISLLWLLCSLPVITIGTATAAALGEFSDPENYYGHKLIRDYFHRFQTHFLQATALWLLFALLMGLLILDISFYQQLSGGAGWILPVLAVILGNFSLGYVRFGCFQLASGERTPFKVLLKQSAKTMLMCFPVWAIMVGIDLAVITTLIRIPYLLMIVVLLPGLYADIHCRLIQMFLRRYEPEAS